ncbi:MAG TPA: hypothetical protein VFQ61_23210 [Polyangiaceae bacterium]|nr:hypothetical protein [Polyangiaceae bacterium]
MSDSVLNWPFEKRLQVTFEKTLPKLGPEARAQLAAIINPTSLAIVAGVLIAWVVSHAFGVGEVIDIIVAVIGIASIGLAVFTGLDYLFDFATGVYRARSERDLDVAADNLAKAIGILGIQAVMAVLFRGAKAPRTGRGGRINLGAAPRNAPLRYKPSIRQDPTQVAGAGYTTMWGDIVVSSLGSAADRAVVLLHEKVHQFLAPKLYILREYRASNRYASYTRSSLYRYIEEALAETIAQVGVNGMKQFFSGIRFPVQSGYMYLTKGGGYAAAFAGAGAIPEAASLVYSGTVLGMAFELWFVAGTTPPE